ERLRQRSLDLATVNRAKMEPGTNRPRAVARTKPVRRLTLRHPASLDGPSLAVMRCRRLFEIFRADQRREKRRSDVWRKANVPGRFALAAGTAKCIDDAFDHLERKAGQVDNGPNRRPGDGHMHAPRVLAPLRAVAVVLRRPFAHDQPLEDQRRLDQRFDGARRCIGRGRIDFGQMLRFEWLHGECRPVVDGLPCFAYAHQVLSLATDDAAPLSIDLLHANSAVTRSGAWEATKSSCPSREQMTPG